MLHRLVNARSVVREIGPKTGASASPPVCCCVSGRDIAHFPRIYSIDDGQYRFTIASEFEDIFSSAYLVSLYALYTKTKYLFDADNENIIFENAWNWLSLLVLVRADDDGPDVISSCYKSNEHEQQQKGTFSSSRQLEIQMYQSAHC
jgi:hypothetical protein